MSSKLRSIRRSAAKYQLANSGTKWSGKKLAKKQNEKKPKSVFSALWRRA